jgi:hypothetical protein
MRRRSHSPDRAVIPSRSHLSSPFSLDFQLSTVNFFLTPLQSALTRNAPVTPLQSADPKTRHLKGDLCLDKVTPRPETGKAVTQGTAPEDNPVEGYLYDLGKSYFGHCGLAASWRYCHERWACLLLRSRGLPWESWFPC